MRALTTTGIVRPDHTLTVQVPADVAPGAHQVVLVFRDEPPRPPGGSGFTDWPAHDVGPADPSMTYRREDIYGDNGR